MHIFIRYDGDRETADLLDNRIFAALKGKPLFEMCWFYMGIAQIALDPRPPPLSNGQMCPKPS